MTSLAAVGTMTAISPVVLFLQHKDQQNQLEGTQKHY